MDGWKSWKREIENSRLLIGGKKVHFGSVKDNYNLTVIETTDLVYPEENLVVVSVNRKYFINPDNPNKLEFSKETIWHEEVCY